jgi:hypothetical protein
MHEGHWSGWLYLGGRWWRAARADSLAACATALSRAADAEGVADADTVLTRNGAPAGPPLGEVYLKDLGKETA